MFLIEISARAESQVRRIDAWWRCQRLDTPNLFLDEFQSVLERLQHMPSSGAPYAVSRPKGVRRLLLRRTRYHIYYTTEEARRCVTIRAVWHAARGPAPSLR